MLYELDMYLKSSMTEDYLYDSALFICIDIINEFSVTEWNKLNSMIPKKDMRWNIRLAECLGGINNKYSFECILKIIITCNNDLFITCNNDLFIACIDALRDMDISLLYKTDLEKLRKKAMLLLKESSLPAHKILKLFIKKADSLIK